MLARVKDRRRSILPSFHPRHVAVAAEFEKRMQPRASRPSCARIGDADGVEAKRLRLSLEGAS
jgi:hypothetical protein